MNILPQLYPLWLALLAVANTAQTANIPVWLDQTDAYVDDTTQYYATRLHVLTNSDSTEHITEVTTSCGCVMATIQRRAISRTAPGDIYIAAVTKNLSSQQPTLIEVYTTRNPTRPLTFTLQKRQTAHSTK